MLAWTLAVMGATLALCLGITVGAWLRGAELRRVERELRALRRDNERLEKYIQDHIHIAWWRRPLSSRAAEYRSKN